VVSLEVIKNREDTVLPNGLKSRPKIVTTADEELGVLDVELTEVAFMRSTAAELEKFVDIRFKLKKREPANPYPRGSLAKTLLSDIHREYSRDVVPKLPKTVFPTVPKPEEVTKTREDPVSTEPF